MFIFDGNREESGSVVAGQILAPEQNPGLATYKLGDLCASVHYL